VALARAYIGIGSNLGDPVRQVRRGISALRSVGEVVAVSSLYRTPAWGKADQPDFTNAAIALDTARSPHQLLWALKAIERELGRIQGERWGPRLIDFDILAYGDEHIDDAHLTIPHRHLFERAFALIPLAEIAPQYEPYLSALPARDRAAITKISP
jgi:2-amino-4-hydroxy-6-hydroxymethyldihydropteridine diphosphokinase